jgi:5-methylcytosine-specific restriction protein B
MSLQSDFELVLSKYSTARKEEVFGAQHPIAQTLTSIERTIAAHLRAQPGNYLVKSSMGRGNWATVPWIAVMDPRETRTTQRGLYVVYLFRSDMSGVYLTLNQGVTEPQETHGTREGRRILKARAAAVREFCTPLTTLGFRADDEINLHVSKGLGLDYQHSTIAYKLYEAAQLPADGTLLRDLDAAVEVYKAILSSNAHSSPTEDSLTSVPELPATVTEEFDFGTAVERLRGYIEASGYVFEPWQIAQFITALRTKPFVILAGISGTGKTRLPLLVSAATGGTAELVAVRPDWTDSSDVLGYVDLAGSFRPGGVLEIARRATVHNDQYVVCVLDEMNLARVELYGAEILSGLENRSAAPGGGYTTPPLVQYALREEDDEWAQVAFPSNFSIVGTVNMDESTQGFSRKVLDRAFVIELSEVDLANWRRPEPASSAQPQVWPVDTWRPRAISLSRLEFLSSDELTIVDRCVQTVVDLNQFLSGAQLQLGYRSRDEIALFCLHASEINHLFTDHNGIAVDPLDLALISKVLPRIVGGHGSVRRALAGLLTWAGTSTTGDQVDTSIALIARWVKEGRPSSLNGCSFPRTTARLCLMSERMSEEGFTSFWL